MAKNSGPTKAWTLLSNHAIVLVYVTRHASATIREISDDVGITERQVSRIIKDLAEGGLIVVHKEGARNHYKLNLEATLRHQSVSSVPLQRIVQVLLPGLQTQHDS